ncbi:MAG: hypothetical protein CMJ18_01000 [Phycisphaeraceae bacterium]|nr:hypothetical protein [Phycisphaeraceae bacterium]
MNRALFRFLWVRHWWTCALCLLPPLGLGLIMGVVYPLFEREKKAFAGVFNFMRRYFPELPDFFSPAGAFVWPFMHPMTLVCLALAPAIPLLGLPAGERGTKSLDLLLATPLGRGPLVGTLVSFAVPVSACVGLAAWIGTLGGAAVAGRADDVPVLAYGLVALNATAMSVMLGSLVLVFSVIGRDRAHASILYAAAVIMFFMADTVGGLWRGGAWIRTLTPLGYYDPSTIATEKADGLGTDLLVLFGIAIVLWIIAWRLQERRRTA